MSEHQPFIPGLENPFGWVYERRHTCIDMQSSSRSDGRVWWWDEEFSHERPDTTVHEIRNLKPVFLGGHA